MRSKLPSSPEFCHCQSAKSLRARVKGAKHATMNQLDLAKLGLLRMTSKGNLYEPSTKGTITFEGWLSKKSPGGIPLIRHWHKRWFVLEAPGKLLYFSDQAKTDLKGIIPLDMVERMLFRSTRLTLLMEATEDTPSRKFSLKADTEEGTKNWVTAINKAFEEIDRLEDEAEEAEGKVAKIGEGDGKYWKVETRKKLNLSVALDKPKKKGELKINPRAKEIEAEHAKEEERKRAAAAEAKKEPEAVVAVAATPVVVATPVAVALAMPVAVAAETTPVATPAVVEEPPPPPPSSEAVSSKPEDAAAMPPAPADTNGDSNNSGGAVSNKMIDDSHANRSVTLC